MNNHIQHQRFNWYKSYRRLLEHYFSLLSLTNNGSSMRMIELFRNQVDKTLTTSCCKLSRFFEFCSGDITGTAKTAPENSIIKLLSRIVCVLIFHYRPHTLSHVCLSLLASIRSDRIILVATLLPRFFTSIRSDPRILSHHRVEAQESSSRTRRTGKLFARCPGRHGGTSQAPKDFGKTKTFIHANVVLIKTLLNFS